MSLSRRRFAGILLGSGAALAAAGLPRGSAGGEGEASLVVQAVSPLLRRAGDDIPATAAREFLDRAMLALTGKGGRGQAWGSLFSPSETVGVKLSCLPGPRLSSSRALTAAIVEGLLAAGLPRRNIIVWERSSRELENAGYRISRSGLRTMGTDELPGGGYDGPVTESGSVGTIFSRIMDEVDALVSVPVLKDHDLAGVSISLKNMYGAIFNPNKFHANRCDPFVADLCRHPQVRGKLRLSVCDASRVQAHNGPAYFPRYAAEYGGLLVSRDPVALDFCGWAIVDGLRRGMGLPSLAASGREPSYIRTAGGMGLGQADGRRIRRLEL
ncbi:MAG: DUF362 domain-containing protein [Candidatus Aminicenantes bacterium]|nr:DUF362 domain-containing protein [Candidatus Aminicenantes bacterium]